MRETKVKEKINKSSQGVTIISLVITIIVLIIVAGVSVSMLSGEKGIYKEAKNTNIELEKQQELKEITSAIDFSKNNGLGDINYTVLKKQLEDVGYTLETSELPTIIQKDSVKYWISANGSIASLVTEPPTTEVQEKTIYKDESSQNSDNKIVVIPEGFKVSSVPDEQKLDTGVVVIAPDGSEFVWIPVDDVTTMYGTLSDGVTKASKLYDIDSNGNITKLNWEENDDGEMSIILTSGSGSNREPEFTQSDNDSGIFTKETMQKDFSEMLKSVEENKGFYIGRYETSFNDQGNAQSKKEVKSASASTESANTWYGLYKIEKEYSEKSELIDRVTSNMIWGCQYDQMLIWMSKNDVDVTIPIGDDRNNSTSRLTGGIETDKINNIYDLYGNGYEWTMEIDYDKSRIFRRRMV